MLVLAILDGWGLTEKDNKNAVLHGNTPFMDLVAREYPGRPIFAHGEHVGLPKGQMGNSEVGHLNIGGGRKIKPDLVVINAMIDDGSFYKHPPLVGFINRIASREGRLHVMGLLSDGGIHSHMKHLRALLEMVDRNSVMTVFLHAFLDGRDTQPKVADKFIREAQEYLDSGSHQYFATIGGRSWGMDRDKNWKRIEKHYRAIVEGKSEYVYESAEKAIHDAFARGETDEFVEPSVIKNEGVDSRILDGDGVIHFNFRADRGIQMTLALTKKDFSEFDFSGRPQMDMLTFTMYDEYLDVDVAFEGEILEHTLTDVVTQAGKKVFKIAETEKWAHVTKFFNGGSVKEIHGEDRVLVQSPIEVRPHYDKKPQMSANEIVGKLVPVILSKDYDLIVVNFANPDMVGHTGVYEAAITAVETVDKCAERVFNAVQEAEGTMIIIADHGNVEEMVDDNGEPATKHTINPVPFYVLDKKYSVRDDIGTLSDVAPTILKLMELEVPSEMTGKSLVI